MRSTADRCQRGDLRTLTEQGKDRGTERTIPPALVSRIWRHFEPYYAAIQAQTLDAN